MFEAIKWHAETISPSLLQEVEAVVDSLSRTRATKSQQVLVPVVRCFPAYVDKTVWCGLTRFRNGALQIRGSLENRPHDVSDAQGRRALAVIESLLTEVSRLPFAFQLV